jgi:hypothetical protein
VRRAAARPEPRQDLGQRREAVVVQHHHHLLTVRPDVLGGADDVRCREQPHLLVRHVGVHPVRAGVGQEVEVARSTGRDQRQRRIPHAILRVGRGLSMPVDDRAFRQPILETHPESLTRLLHQAVPAIRAKQA